MVRKEGGETNCLIEYLKRRLMGRRRTSGGPKRREKVVWDRMTRWGMGRKWWPKCDGWVAAYAPVWY